MLIKTWIILWGYEFVLATKLTIKLMHKLISHSGLKIISNSKFAVRPDYKLKFGLPTVNLPSVYIPLLTELFCTGEEIILQKG